jgi:TolB-like protein
MALAATVAVLIAVAGVGLWLRPWQATLEPVSIEKMAFPLPDKPSIAVMPFANMSDEPSQEYFADGMTEDLITDLSKVSGLFVIARNSTFAYKGKSHDVKQVAAELGIRYVLEGSVRRVGNQVRINAQLIDATTGGHLWAERYDGSLSDVFALQDKVTRQIVRVLAVQLTSGEQEAAVRKETENTEAYDTFLKGWEQYLRQRPESFRQAIALFEKAVELDPKYSRAYAALAATYWQVWKRYWHNALGLGSNVWHDVRFKAEEFLAKAMEDPTPLALQVSATMLAQQGRHDEAIAEGERAVAMDPNDADGYVALAGALNLAGMPEKALRLMERAMRLNPHYPTSYLYELGLARFGMEEFDEAAVALERAVILNPDDRWTSRLMIATLGRLGRAGEAAAIMDRAEANWRGFDPLSVRGITFWYPFKEPADAERFADGLRKAGIPD